MPSQEQAPVSAVHCRNHPVLFITTTTDSHSCTTRGYTAHHKPSPVTRVHSRILHTRPIL